MTSFRTPHPRPAAHAALAGTVAVCLATLPLPLAAQSPSAGAAGDQGLRIELEVQRYDFSKNDIQRPNDATGDRFSALPFTGTGVTEPRLSIEMPFERWGKDHRLRFTYAPLSLQGTGVSDTPIRYQGAAFAAGAPIDALYRFDTYRATYSVPVFGPDDPAAGWAFRVGGTLAVRDAQIRLRQGGTEQSFSNVGPAPLLYLAARRQLSAGWTFEAEFDGFPAPGGGGLFDGIARLRYQVSPTVSIAAGVRHLQGGATDTDFYNSVRTTAATIAVRVGF